MRSPFADQRIESATIFNVMTPNTQMPNGIELSNRRFPVFWNAMIRTDADKDAQSQLTSRTPPAFDASNNAEIEKYWRGTALEAIEKFVNNHKDENILIIEVLNKDETYFYGFLNEDNLEMSAQEIEKRFIKEIR